MKHTFFKHLLNFILLALGAICTALVIWLDVAIFKDGIQEISATEFLQELSLLAISALFFLQARKHPALRGGMILIGGFFFCMLIRELDALFDLIHYGSWVYFASLFAVYCIAWACITPKTSLRGLSAFLVHPACHYMVCGLVLILVFSRVFGMNMIWKVVMQGEYVRTVKNIVEEGTELMGYLLCLGSAVAFWQRSEPLKTL
ncbi:hypothetical protein [Rahnella sp. WP5]|uniref:hypothetical protein n=1 Tax=Rahnella sp. WP5 TaxID=1500266 RepID=UPI000566A7E0|nr:hypothetical protein [Rahnella sp. WP5]